jgi:GMP synthase (glutamine-hydrolysing)
MIQFHPEVEHTEYGSQILQNFIEICGISKKHTIIEASVLIQQIRTTVGEKHVIGAISGGVDSTVAGTLVAKAIGKQFTPIFVDNGLMRDDAVLTVKKTFEPFGITPIVVDVRNEMLRRLQGITDSEEKRKVIGKFYIEVFEEEMQKLLQKDKDVAFLLQGTIYSDVIESQGTKYASKIKSHHNVGGLPEHMKLKLLEPLREFYKDEVRSLGRTIGLSDELIMKQPFPGPGYAVRIRGEVTAVRLAQEEQADSIVLEELRRSGWLERVFISFPVMTGAYSTATKGDGKFFGEVVALRVVESTDIMTATWAKLPYDLLQKISSRIVNEVPNISRVVYDITTKPPATMEWE